MTPENRLLYNLWVQWVRRGFRVALWGHGANFQGTHDSVRERFKRVAARHADWWFAYTDASLPHLARSRFPRDRVTVLNNAIDTSALQRQRLAVHPARLQGLAAEFGLGGGPVGIYVGSLYADKRIGFLLDAARRVRELTTGFELIVVGDGPDRGRVEQFCAEHPWAHYAGLRFGQDKVDLMSLARVVMNPGMVGLGILDALILQTPLVTTDCGTHSPEIAYLRHGHNGLMTANALEPYAQAVAGLLRDDAQLALLRQGCAESAPIYTLERMADNYANGIVECLQRPPLRRGVPAVPAGVLR
jgi:glycosyltransferase involved in cell wall biosynthesis